VRSAGLLRLQALAALLVLAASVGACGAEAGEGGGDGAREGRIVLTGSSTVAPLVGEIAKRFEAEHAGVRVDVQTGGSSQGIADARRGTAEIGMSSRDLTPSEAEALERHVLAYDGVAVLVHGENSVEGLTDDEVRKIYTGRITRWSEVGGEEAPITVINRADGRAEFQVVGRYLGIAPGDFRADLVSGENQHGIKAVASDPRAIIYISLGASLYAIEEGLPLKVLRWNGVEPTPGAVASGRFPVRRPLILVTRSEISERTKAFLDFATSERVHDLIERFRYAPPVG